MSHWGSIDEAIARCCMNGILGFVCGCCSDLRCHNLGFEGLVKFLGLLLSLAFLTKGIHEFAIFLSEVTLFGLRCCLQCLLSVDGLGGKVSSTDPGACLGDPGSRNWLRG